jgi:hypothetical protein
MSAAEERTASQGMTDIEAALSWLARKQNAIIFFENDNWMKYTL